MEYLIGVILAFAVCGLGTIAGFDRDRSFYPVMLIVVASYYDLFAVLGGGSALAVESGAFLLFLLASVVGLRTSLWIVVVALAGHGVFDFFHGRLVANAGVPAWWPMFCLSFDVAAAAYLAWRLAGRRINARGLAAS